MLGTNHYQPNYTIIPENDYFQKLRKTEYPILDAQQQVYLDYTGGNLIPRSLLKKHQQMLLENVLGNPHSTNPTSRRATQLVEEARRAVLDFFQAHDYECIFTANASAALKIVGECYPFDKNSQYVLTADNHNSVNGIREFCSRRQGKVRYIPVNAQDLGLDEGKMQEALQTVSPDTNQLFAFPAQSNVSGVKHDLKWISYAQEKGYDVLLDAAAFVPTSSLDLSVYQPEFVSMSFYKIFGYPTGIGCLLIKKSAFRKLQKPWFAGGTVTLVSVVAQQRFLANGHERFEDGTVNYTNIPCVKTGLDFISAIGMQRISFRMNGLIRYLYERLKQQRHYNGKAIVKVFGPEQFSRRGGNMIMNFTDVRGRTIPFQYIEQLANARRISIRTGCFCNPGIDEINNCISQQDMQAYFAEKSSGDYRDMVSFLGKMRGAVRVSVGLATNHQDLDTFVELAASLKNKVIG